MVEGFWTTQGLLTFDYIVPVMRDFDSKLWALWPLWLPQLPAVIPFPYWADYPDVLMPLLMEPDERVMWQGVN